MLHKGYLMDHSHFRNDQKIIAHIILESVFEHKSMYLWDPYTYGGNPFFGEPQTYLICPTLLFLLVTKNIYFTLNASLILHFFLMGLGMYLVVLRLTKNKTSAFLSAIIYMFNSYSFNFGIHGNLSILVPISLAPFVFYFADKALDKRKPLVYAAVTSIFLAIILHAGGVALWIYIVLMIGLYYIFNILTNNVKDAAKKSGILVFIILLTILLSTVKIFSSLEYGEKTSRQNMEYQYFLEGKIEAKELFNNLVFNLKNPKQGIARIGIASWLLIFCCIPFVKKKKVLFFSSIMLLAILIAGGSFVTYIMYKVIPFYSQLKHPERSLILFVFAGAVLAGLGYRYISLVMQKKRVLQKIIFPLVLLLLIAEFSVIDVLPKGAYFDKVPIPALEYIAKDKELFRLHHLSMDAPPFQNVIGAFGQSYAIDYGIPMIIGGGSSWLRDYVKATMSAETYKSAKLWGVLNVKYFIAEKEVNVNNITLINKFKECLECKDKIIDGPYLYKNELFLPRAYIVDNAILVVGDNVEDTAYSTLLHPDFDPSNTVIIMKKGNINDYDLEYLKRFKVLLLTPGSIDRGTNLAELKGYADAGGIVLPNILENKQSITNEELISVLRELKGVYSNTKKININYFSPNKVELNLDGKTGFLVLSEKYYLFPDWTAKINGKEKEILRANGVVSAVYLNGESGNLVFRYKPKSFIIGAWISSITLLAILGYFVFVFIKKRKLWIICCVNHFSNAVI